MTDVTSRGPRLLVVDDEALICEVIQMMLEEKHDVVLATSGAEARALLERDRRFDTIFCDLMMPVVSGMDLHGWLVEHDAGLAGRMVFMTGGAYTPQARQFLEQRAMRHIGKPLDWQALEGAIRDLTG
jgi:CheY-like chemotaxis protein